jgi:type VI secretion system secreted protein Hcp
MAAVDYFLKIDGIPGESQDAKHKNEIQVESWSLGGRQQGSMGHGGGGGAGKVQMLDAQFTSKLSKASPKLFLALATGEHIKKAVLTVRKAGKTQQDYFTITFTDSIVSSYQTIGTHGPDPTEQFSLNFAKFEIQYKEQQANGTLGAAVQVGYDLKQMQST